MPISVFDDQSIEILPTLRPDIAQNHRLAAR